MGHYHSTPGGPLYVHDYGGEGRPVVCIHGLGGAHVNWLSAAPGLAKHGAVTAVDLPGFGFSPPQRSSSLSVHRRAVEAYLETLARPALLIGNSLGGLVAELVAAERPDLVEALVTVSPATPIPPGRTEIDWEVTRRLILQALPVVGTLYVRSYFSRTTAAQQVADTLGLVTYRRTAVSQEMVLESVRLARFRRAMPWVVPALVGAGRSTGIYLARRKRFAEMISRVKAPTLLIQGVHDRVIAPGSIRWLASLRPDWRLEMMEDTAHCPQLDTPERFVALIDDWLASMSSGPRR